MLKLGKKSLAMLLAFTMLLCCAATAFAADIDFGDGTGNAYVNGADSGNSSGIITSGDADNSVTGNGSNYGLHFTAPDATVTVNGNTTVGKGIEADGNLTITGDTSNGADTLTTTGNTTGGGNADGTPGIDLGAANTLTIDGGVTVDATGVGHINPSNDNPGVSAGVIRIKNGTLNAHSAGNNGNAIVAEYIYVNGVRVNNPGGLSATLSYRILTNAQGGYAGIERIISGEGYTADEIDAALKYLAELLAKYDAGYAANYAANGSRSDKAAYDAFFSGLRSAIMSNRPPFDVLAASSSDFAAALKKFVSEYSSEDFGGNLYVLGPDIIKFTDALRSALTKLGYYPIPQAAN